MKKERLTDIIGPVLERCDAGKKDMSAKISAEDIHALKFENKRPGECVWSKLKVPCTLTKYQSPSCRSIVLHFHAQDLTSYYRLACPSYKIVNFIFRHQIISHNKPQIFHHNLQSTSVLLIKKHKYKPQPIHIFILSSQRPKKALTIVSTPFVCSLSVSATERQQHSVPHGNGFALVQHIKCVSIQGLFVPRLPPTW